MMSRRRQEPPKRNVRGMPPHVPTEQSRAFARVMLADGKAQGEVSAVIGIDEKTLRKYYRAEIDTAFLKANAAVSTSLFNNATGGGDWTKANIGAAIWWDKSRNGKREPTQDHRLTGAIGTYDLSKLPEEKLLLAEKLLGQLEVLLAGASAVGGGTGGNRAQES